MLEIILLFVLGKKIGAIARAKDREGWPWVLLFVGMWFGGEIFGALAGVVLALDMKIPRDNQFFLIWSTSICGAALGASLAYYIVSSLPSLLVESLAPDLSQAFSAPSKGEDYEEYQDPSWRQTR